MNRTEFLRNANVRNFINWMAARLDTGTFAHTWINRRTRLRWACASLYDAFQNYRWQFRMRLGAEDVRGETFEENSGILDQISAGLRQAVHEDNDTDTLYWSLVVMRWGGVFAGNGAWLEERRNGLAQRIGENAEVLFSDQTEEDDLSGIDRFNSGFTKLYSLLGSSFNIYDSRVAAALGWMVRRYCEEHGLDRVPSVLSFPHGTAKESPGTRHPKQRDPSRGRLQFPRLTSGTCHAWANLRAGWLLNEVLEQNPDSRFHEQAQPLRALEGALFMIGYDLGGGGNTPPGRNGRPLESDDEGSSDDDGSGWDGAFFRLETRGGKRRRRRFGYRVTENALEIENVNGRVDVFPFGELHAILQSLRMQFEDRWFPLANNVEKLGNGTERAGLGRTILDPVTGDITHAQASSYLGRVLEDIGLAEWNGKRRGIEWRLTGAHPETEDELAALLTQQQES